MTKHFLVNQLKHETHTPASFVKKLYDLISKQELTEDEYIKPISELPVELQ